MKKLYFLFFYSLTFQVLQAQVSISSGNTSPHSSAMLEVSSTSKGFLPPKMTQDQILAIPSPAEGLIVYNLTYHKPAYYNGTKWSFMNDSSMLLKVGDSYVGGIIVYLDNTGIHGIVAAPTDQSEINSVVWGCNGTLINGASGTAIGTGLANTTAIVNDCPTSNIAARICYDLVLNGYSDWYLPSKDEFIKACEAKQYLNLAGGLYYTSSQYSSNAAWYNSSSCSAFGGDRDKSFPMTVRAVRSF
jgi:hypothetical protein